MTEAQVRPAPLDDPVVWAAVQANIAAAPPLSREQIELVNRAFRSAGDGERVAS